MNNFQRALKHKNSSVIDEKIAHLDEMMTTTGLYSNVKQDNGVDEVPPTFSDAPLGDFADLDDFEWDSDAQGDGSTVNHDLSQLQTTDVEGNLQRIFNMPDIPVQEDGSTYVGTPYAMALSDSMALTGTSLGYINGNGYNHVYQLDNVFGVQYSDFAIKFAEAYENGTFTQKTIYLWADIDCLFGQCRGGIAYYPSNLSNTSTPKATRALYAYNLLIPTENGNIKRNQVKTDIGVRAKPPKVLRVISRDNLGDPNYYPGFIKGFMDTIKDIGSNIVETFTEFTDSLSSEFPEVAGLSNIFTGVGDGLGLLGDVQSTLDKARSEGNIIPPDKPGERPKIAPGAEGSAENPIKNNLSDSSTKVLQDAASDYNGDGSKESLIRHFNKVTSSGETVGLKGTINNINTGEGNVEIRGDDIVITDTYGFGPSQDIVEKPVVSQVNDLVVTIYEGLGLDSQEASKQVQTFFDQSGPLGAAAGVIASQNKTTSIGLPGKNDPVVYYETVIPGGAKNLGSNSKPVKEETLFEKYKKKTEKKESVGKMDELSKSLKSLPVPIKKVLLFEVQSSLKLMMMSPDERSFRQKEVKMQGVNVYHNAYVDNQFPEKVEQTSRVKKILSRNIKLSDPKTFKSVKEPVTYEKMFRGEDPNRRVRIKDHSKKSAGRFLKTEKKKDTSRLRWLKG